MTEEQTVERVARAAFDAMTGRTHTGAEWDTRIGETQDDYRHMARAAIAAYTAALAEAWPTDAMIYAALCHFPMVMTETLARKVIADMWRDMLAAAPQFSSDAAGSD